MDAEQAICTNFVLNKYSKRKNLTQSKKKSPEAIRSEIELQIMDRGDVSIEKVAKQFLVHWKFNIPEKFWILGCWVSGF